MGTFLHLYETEQEFDEIYNSSAYTTPWVSYTKDVAKVYYNKQEVPNYLTFEVIGDGSINIGHDNIEYNRGNGWESVDVVPFSLIVQPGDIIEFRAPIGNPNVNVQNCFLGTTCGFNVKGNIMSLLDGENFESMTELTNENEYTFSGMFSDCTGLTSAENLVLPATTLASCSCRYMFRNCSSLTTAPELPATTMAVECYAYMFIGCSSLTTAPELPATTLASNCYESMFANCISLTTAPLILPATTLIQGCYRSMFQACRSLTTAPALPATTLTQSCYSDMFRNCTSLTTAPELLATTLVGSCYSYMFNGCSSLNYIKCLATNIPTYSCTDEWVYGVSSTGTFIKSPDMNDWATGNDGIPVNWTVEDAS